MKEELISLIRNNTPENGYKNCYLIKCIGYGMKSKEWIKRKYISKLNNLDIVLLSYFGDRNYHKEDNNWGSEFFYENIDKGPLSFILPYLYDDNELDVFDRGWQRLQTVEVYWCDENGVMWKEQLPRITDIFDNINELVSYIKNEIKIISPPYEDEEGVMVEPWEIDEAREVLEQAGWDEQELRYLEWYGCDRAFGACIEIPQKFADYMSAKFDKDNKKDQYVLDIILDALRIANQKCTSLGWNGPQGMCGTYIYRANEEIVNDLGIDESSVVRMPDGRIYILHEGD